MLTQITKKQLERLKDALPLYRKILGYSAEKFGSYLGLKRQQISSLETGRTTLTQVHFRAITQIISETVSDKAEKNEINIVLFIILVLLNENEEMLDDDEYLYWKDIMIQFSKLDDVGDSDNQVKLLKGFAFASKDLNKGDIVPTIEFLDDIITGYKEFIQKMNDIANKEEKV
ncbi:helix-turn-helix domain-containing protein [Mariniplasma anaerobium]|uniref:Uncharacterized protein n=1 Tax=Mariniplasma anaerobium TaxID=2735436 RepID=A0A7U9TL20_9MOLU|nr:helix-turn-helix transcriptional regulator [Mariniplasma anaerobium]BCR36749.1 hypothetical protein MPAN_016420 [Mariniplasma anaerobium]